MSNYTYENETSEQYKAYLKYLDNKSQNYDPQNKKDLYLDKELLELSWKCLAYNCSYLYHFFNRPDLLIRDTPFPLYDLYILISKQAESYFKLVDYFLINSSQYHLASRNPLIEIIILECLGLQLFACFVTQIFVVLAAVISQLARTFLVDLPLQLIKLTRQVGTLIYQDSKHFESAPKDPDAEPGIEMLPLTKRC